MSYTPPLADVLACCFSFSACVLILLAGVLELVGALQKYRKERERRILRSMFEKGIEL